MRFLLLLIVLSLSNCSQKKQVTGFEEYKNKVKAKYYKAMDALASANYTQAKKLFQELSNESGIVKYSVLARLRLGDTLLAEGDYSTAIYVYEEFLKQYRGNKNEAYAFFRKCQCYDKQIPSDIWILPPPETKDISYVKMAYVCYQSFMQQYKYSRFYPIAEQRYKHITELLYKNELYVVNFYWKREKYRAVTLRLKRVLENYPDRGKTETNYYRLIKSLVMIKDLTGAKNYYTEYTTLFPKGKYVATLKKWLKEKISGENYE